MVRPARKWLHNIEPQDAVAKAARRTLATQLDAVAHYLPRAARKAKQDVENVHNLRVWSRRALVALKLYGDLLPEAKAKWVRKRLKHLREAACDARDYDVLAALPLEKRLRRHVEQRRVAAQKPLRKIEKRLLADARFARRLKALPKKATAQEQNFEAWAKTRLLDVAEAFFRAAPGTSTETSLEALHAFRIRGKELCYAMEMLCGAFPAVLQKNVYPQVQAIQTRLGAISDLALVQARLQHLLIETHRKKDEKAINRLLLKKQKKLARLRHEFTQWCTTARLDELRAQFNGLLPPDTQVRDMQKFRLIDGDKKAA